MNQLQVRPVPFKFQLGDLTLFSISVPLQMWSEELGSQPGPVPTLEPPVIDLIDGSEGFAIRALPIVAEPAPIARSGSYLRYIPLQYDHSYIDLGQSFDDYKRKFSSKTRSTINRKMRKYAEYCGGSISWTTYKTSPEMDDFFEHAHVVSEKTYQEKLLDAGLPRSSSFARSARVLADENKVRAYILFDRIRPVSYLYCPVHDGTVIYAYLGYDPDYARFSVGTILQWLAIEQLFQDGSFRYFDFTEGQSEHKRLFSTHQRRCANVFFLKRSVRNVTLIYAHVVVSRISTWLGDMLDRAGVKARIRRLLRFGHVGKVLKRS